MVDHIMADGETYPTPEHGWVCFHCGEHFAPTLAGWRAAADHFGEGFTDSIPACRLRMRKGELSLLRRIRWLERQLRELQMRVAQEDTDKDRELYAMASDHRRALIREEEKGYARGVVDARNEAKESCM
jgi:hypothetical protein